MSVWEIIIGIVLIVFSLIIIGVVLLQEGRQAIWARFRAPRTALWKRARPAPDAKLAKYTKVIAITFFVLVFIGMLITKFT